jgi:hypothetical protein
MNRRVLVSLIALSLLMLAPIANVAADTGGGAPEPIDVYVAGTGFSFVDRNGMEWSGYAQVDENRLAGTRAFSFFFSASVGSQICNPGTDDEYEAGDYVEFFAARSRIVEYRMADDLSRAAVAAEVVGPRSRFDACTGELEQRRREEHSVAFKLRPTAPPESMVDVFCRPLEEGSSAGVEVMEILTLADAAGPVVIDGRSVTQSDGSLQRFQAILGDPCEVPPEG